MTTLAEIRRRSDDKKWAAAARLMAAVNNHKTAVRAYGAFSIQANIAFEEMVAADKAARKVSK